MTTSMVKNRDEVRRDVLDMCGWVQDSYQLPENFLAILAKW